MFLQGGGPVVAAGAGGGDQRGSTSNLRVHAPHVGVGPGTPQGTSPQGSSVGTGGAGGTSVGSAFDAGSAAIGGPLQGQGQGQGHGSWQPGYRPGGAPGLVPQAGSSSALSVGAASGLWAGDSASQAGPWGTRGGDPSAQQPHAHIHPQQQQQPNGAASVVHSSHPSAAGYAPLQGALGIASPAAAAVSPLGDTFLVFPSSPDDAADFLQRVAGGGSRSRSRSRRAGSRSDRRVAMSGTS